MIGGVVTLGVVGFVAALAAEYGYDAIAIAVIQAQLLHKTKDEIWSEISKKRLPKALKTKIKYYVDRA